MRLWNPKQPPWDHPGCAFFIAITIGVIIILWFAGVFS